MSETYTESSSEEENNDYKPISKEVESAIENFSDNISTFKYSLYQTLVQKDSSHHSEDMGPLFDYHGTFLQSIGYWIGVLDSNILESPIFSDKKLQSMFDTITDSVKELGKMSMDSRTLAYNVLYKKSVAHPFNFVRSKVESDE